MDDTPDPYVDAFLEEATGLTFTERAFVRALAGPAEPPSGWRADLALDRSLLALQARLAYGMAREQKLMPGLIVTGNPSQRAHAAALLAAWRLTRA